MKGGTQMLFSMSRLLLNHLSLFGHRTNDGDTHVINPKTSRFEGRLLFSLAAEALLDPSSPCIMKCYIVAAFAAAAAALPEVANLAGRQNGCNADNCLRAVRATRFGTATMELRMAECSSFLAVTQIPATSTVYITESSIQTITANSTKTIYQRQAAETPISATKVIPTYASACVDERRYSSACSCFGATAATTTAPTPIVTSTVTFVSTTTLAPFVNVTRPALECSNTWNCGDRVIPVCSSETGCVCFQTVEGRKVCAQPNDCSPSCDTTNDCSNGEVCIKQSCCSGGTCMKVDVCLNQALPKMMFKRRNAAWVKKEARGDLQHLSLVPHDAEIEKLA
ncbi:hypothetical protein CSPX01_09317 [Colletotrichum filicis]|nr:hypothetical protein CSPX01_09317 [Colletotrichum filicis]